MSALAKVLIVLLAPLWLGAIALGCIAGFVWEFFYAGMSIAEDFKDWLDAAAEEPS